MVKEGDENKSVRVIVLVLAPNSHRSFFFSPKEVGESVAVTRLEVEM